MPYPDGPLKTRAVVKPGMYAVIPPEGRVFNVIPNIQGCQMTILCTPKIGASFVQYIGTAQPGGGTIVPFGTEKDIETFIYFLDGEGTLEVQVGSEKKTYGQGGYAYAPAGVGISFKNTGTSPSGSCCINRSISRTRTPRRRRMLSSATSTTSRNAFTTRWKMSSSAICSPSTKPLT